jgi:hypothetical protein
MKELKSHQDLEQCFMKAMEDHADRVAYIRLATAQNVKGDMLESMKRVWSFVSQQPIRRS